jgi:hypothetical protein
VKVSLDVNAQHNLRFRIILDETKHNLILHAIWEQELKFCLFHPIQAKCKAFVSRRRLAKSFGTTDEIEGLFKHSDQ